MLLRRLKNRIIESDLELHDKLFVLLSGVALLALIIIFFVGIIIGETGTDLLMLGGAILIAGLLSMFAIVKRKIGIMAGLFSFIIVFFLLPVTFFTGGAIFGGGPLWFVFAILFISLTLRRKVKLIFLHALIFVSAACYAFAYKYPSYVTSHDYTMAYLDSFISLLLIMSSISIMITFVTKLYTLENEKAEARKKEIEELNASQNHFFSSMSHEIRTPINTIIGLNEMILREDVSAEVAEDAANIQSASKMLLHLINDILDMSKLESGKMQLNMDSYNIGDMLSDVVGMLWIRAKDKGLEFHVDLEPDMPSGYLGDEVRIKQILINVINNSIKYTKTGSVTLSIQCAKQDNGMANVIFTVTDTGIGIKKENIPYLFTAFKRVEEDRNKYIEGTGLGLSIVKQFVDMMGGKITVNSVYTKGSTFIIEIPQKIVDEESVGEFGLENRAAMQMRETYHRSFEAPSARVLVVDDNASNLMVVKKLLRDTLVKIDTVESGKEALEKTLEIEYNVIFMDHMMPEMDGIECLKKIRAQAGGRCKQSKIVALTANSGADNQQLYVREGFDGYLLKPISGEAIEQELYRQLPREMVVVSDDDAAILEESTAWMQKHNKKTDVVITTESVADIPKSLLKKHNIAVIPYLVETEAGLFEDGFEIESHGLISYMNRDNNLAWTKAPSVDEHEAFFAEQLAKANNVIHMSISKKVNNSGCEIAMEAAGIFENVTVFDTGNLSSGQGIMVLEACRMAEEGMPVDKILANLERMKSKIHSNFIVDNMDYLAKSGQVGEYLSSIAKAFNVHPVMLLHNGKMSVGGFYFGSRERAWRKYINRMVNKMSTADKKYLFVTYVGLSQKDIEEIRSIIANRLNFENVYFQKASPAIAVNCGPETFGLLYMDE
ncbi:MAG: DegV family EDD domain-containing protein [Lachnospiraceae bacterium]|nr:DegV family EDD domain-containing protein [Lachnospiraceae bacterium]